MISVLIPTYNYDISKLIETLHIQLIETKVDFEIIVLEDGSTQNLNTNYNLSHTSTIINTHNIGRVKARQALALKAKYDWLLFLDADVTPKTKTFIKNYIEAITLGYDAYFGGFAYHENKPESSYILRWKYGKTKEQVPATIRNKSPYKVIISANYMMKKVVFNHINSKIQDNKGYGFDNYFGALLQKNTIKIHHLDNQVYHLGIEKSITYLQKTEQAAITLLHFYKTEGFNNHSNDLLRLFTTLKRYRLTWIFSGFYFLFKKPMTINLLGNSPQIQLLQVYKICYMCAVSKN